jgi:hypothetical protein
MPTLLQSQPESVSSAICAFGPPGLKSHGHGVAEQRTPERESAFIVKNTFLEVPEEEANNSSEEDMSPFLVRRRRGSSFYRSASEPRFPHKIDSSILEAEAKLTSHSIDAAAQEEGRGLITEANYPSWSLQSALADENRLGAASEIPVQQPSSGSTPSAYEAARHSAFAQHQYYHDSQPAIAFAPVHQIAGPQQSDNSAGGWPTYADPRSSWPCHPSHIAGTFNANDTTAVAAAMYAGFNAGLMAALSANQPAASVRPAKTVSPQTQARHASARSYDDHKPVHHMSRDQTRHHSGTATHKYSQAQHLNGVLALSHLPYRDSRLRGGVRESLSCGVSDASTAVSRGVSSLHELRTPSPSPEPSRAPCHIIWCDQRAFKEVSDSWKKQLETATGIQVKTHKTSEKCIRLLRKKQHSQARPPCVFLVSWANAPTLLPFLADSPNILAKVILLCDTDMCRGRNRDAADRLASGFPFVAHLAASWADAVEAASILVGELNGFELTGLH